MDNFYVNLGTAQNRATPLRHSPGFKNCYPIRYRPKSDVMVEKEEIARAVADELEKHRSIDVESHRKHHEFIEHLIKVSSHREARRERIIQAVGGWGIITALTGIALAVWHYIKSSING